MAKVTTKSVQLTCDVSGEVDGTIREDGSIVIVRPSTVVGTASAVKAGEDGTGALEGVGRKDLSDRVRAQLLALAGYTEDEAARILAEHNAERVRKPRTVKEINEADAASSAEPVDPAAEADPAAESNGKGKRGAALASV